MKTNLFIIMLILLYSCNSQKPIATTHTERIEERVMPVAVGADTIEIVLSHTDNILHTERTECTEYAVATPAEDRLINDFEQSEKSNSVSFVGSVRNNNSVRIKSTRGVNISRYETDTTSTLRITLRPDTVFVPYTNHIRSDTIVVPDRVCQQKLIRTNMTSFILILILIMIIIIFLKNRMTRK